MSLVIPFWGYPYSASTSIYLDCTGDRYSEHCYSYKCVLLYNCGIKAPKDKRPVIVSARAEAPRLKKIFGTP